MDELKTPELLRNINGVMNDQNSWVTALLRSLVSLKSDFESDIESLNTKCSIILGILICLVFILLNNKH